MSNFVCLDCNKENNIPIFKQVFDDKGNSVYKEKNRNCKLKCEDCGSENLKYVEVKGGYNVNFGFFNSLDSNQKKAVLKKRATNHFNSKCKQKADHISKSIERGGSIYG